MLSRGYWNLCLLLKAIGAHLHPETEGVVWFEVCNSNNTCFLLKRFDEARGETCRCVRVSHVFRFTFNGDGSTVMARIISMSLGLEWPYLIIQTKVTANDAKLFSFWRLHLVNKALPLCYG